MRIKAITQIFKLRLTRGIIKVPLIIFWHLKLDWAFARYVGFTLFVFNRKELVRQNNKTAILVMDRGIFDDDVNALKRYSNSHGLGISFIHIESYYRRTLEVLMLPQELRNQIEFYGHLAQNKKLSKRVYAIQGKVLDSLEFLTGSTIKVFLSGNINYAQDYHWIGTMKNRGGVFVALNKESIIYSPNHQAYRIALHKEHNFFYEGDFALFYNNRAKETYIQAGAVLPENSIAIGSPKVDDLILLSQRASVPQNIDKFILLLSFNRPHIDKVSQLYKEVIETIAADPYLASKTIIKCKNDAEAQKLMMEFPSINATSGSLQNFLEMRPSIAVGFNSTACLEVLIAGIPLIVPMWKEARYLNQEDILLGAHTQSFHLVAKSKESFSRCLKKYLDKQNENILAQPKTPHTYGEELKKFIEYYYSPLDGKSSERFFRFLQEHI